MRGASLSNQTVIGLLNSSYVPVFVSNEDYTDNGAASVYDKAELHRIFQEGYAKHLSVGTVHVYILSPDGHLVDSLHVAEASKPERLIELLRKSAFSLHVAAGQPLVSPTVPAPPACAPGDLQLHLVARYLRPIDGELAPIQSEGGDWTALPAEDWIDLTRIDMAKLLPPRDQEHVGGAWQVQPALAAKLLAHFYPPTENWDLAANRLDRDSLSGEVVSSQHGVVTARITGSLAMQHSFYHKPDDRRVECTVLGYMTFDPASRRVRRIEMATESATYRGSGGDMPFGVVVSSL